VKDIKIFVCGHRGMVGSAILRQLQKEGYTNIIYKTHSELDLTRQSDVESFFELERPDWVFLAAAKVGGIMANNTYRGDFIYQNIMIQSNVIHSSYKWGVKKLLFLGSTCVYPKNCPQPIKEEYLLTSALEPTNEPYGVAKISGIKMCESYRRQYGCNFISVMPTNLYGPGDNYHLQNSHVLPAMIKKFHDAKISGESPIFWGTGVPTREFLHVDDLAEACLFLMLNYNDLELVNIGSGVEISIKDLANLISDIVGYTGDIIWDSTKPDGTMRKLSCVDKINSLGWKSKIDLRSGITKVYNDYINQ
jgi:GDP-L-fucose synthase